MTRKSVLRKKLEMSVTKPAQWKSEVAQRLQNCSWLVILFTKQGKPGDVWMVLWL